MEKGWLLGGCGGKINFLQSNITLHYSTDKRHEITSRRKKQSELMMMMRLSGTVYILFMLEAEAEAGGVGMALAGMNERPTTEAW